MLFLVSYPQSNPANGTIRVYNASGSTHTLATTLPVTLSSAGNSTMILESNPMYLALSINTSIYIYNISQNFSSLCNIIVNGSSLYNIRLTNYTFFVSTDLEIAQYSLFVCRKWLTIAATGVSHIDLINNAATLLLWK